MRLLTMISSVTRRLLCVAILFQHCTHALPMDQGHDEGSWGRGDWLEHQNAAWYGQNWHPTFPSSHPSNLPVLDSSPVLDGSHIRDEFSSSSYRRLPYHHSEDANAHPYDGSIYDAQPPSPNPELDQKILDSILEDLNQHEEATSSGHFRDSTVPALHSESQELAQSTSSHLSSVPASSQHTLRISNNGAATSSTQAERSTRLLPYFPREPRFLREIPYLPPRGTKHPRTKIVIAEDEAIHNTINQNIFNGRFTWVPLNNVPKFNKAMSKRSPNHQRYRRLPRILMPPRQGSEAGASSVYITDHFPHKGSQLDIGTPLEDKPYYTFWGLPETLKLHKSEIHFYGMGYLDPKYYKEVERYARRAGGVTGQALSHFQA